MKPIDTHNTILQQKILGRNNRLVYVGEYEEPIAKPHIQNGKLVSTRTVRQYTHKKIGKSWNKA